jgi:hypothetical protein
MSLSVSMSISVSMCVSMTVSMSVSISMSVSCPFLCPCQFKYGAMNIYVQHGNHSINFQGLYEVARKLKEIESRDIILVKRIYLKRT